MGFRKSHCVRTVEDKSPLWWVHERQRWVSKKSAFMYSIQYIIEAICFSACPTGLKYISTWSDGPLCDMTVFCALRTYLLSNQRLKTVATCGGKERSRRSKRAGQRQKQAGAGNAPRRSMILEGCPYWRVAARYLLKPTRGSRGRRFASPLRRNATGACAGQDLMILAETKARQFSFLYSGAWSPGSCRASKRTLSIIEQKTCPVFVDARLRRCSRVEWLQNKSPSILIHFHIPTDALNLFLPYLNHSSALLTFDHFPLIMGHQQHVLLSKSVAFYTVQLEHGCKLHGRDRNTKRKCLALMRRGMLNNTHSEMISHRKICLLECTFQRNDPDYKLHVSLFPGSAMLFQGRSGIAGKEKNGSGTAP